MKQKGILMLSIFLISIVKLSAQCASPANIFTFTYAGHTYEVIKELKTWMEAKPCAEQRGGYLVAIESDVEKNYIMGQLMMSSAANISPTYHAVTDGGGASYIWTGGSDAITEGSWYWQGSPLMAPFYTGQGTAGAGNGSPVGGAYVNWGNVNGSEPDNFFYLHDQDALGIAMNSWPHGVAGQWNDIDMNNTLYYSVEIEGSSTSCTTPTSLSSTNITTNSASIAWVSSSPDFNVRYKSTSEVSWTNTSSTLSVFALINLLPNTTYDFQIKAICSTTPSDTSSWSVVSHFTTLNNTSVEENYNQKISLYPNPVDNYIQIVGMKDLNAIIQIYDIKGQKMSENSYSNLLEGKIEISTLSKGVYAVFITSNNERFALKFVK